MLANPQLALMSDVTKQIHGEQARIFLLTLRNHGGRRLCFFSATCSKHTNLLTGKQLYEIGPIYCVYCVEISLT